MGQAVSRQPKIGREKRRRKKNVNKIIDRRMCLLVINICINVYRKREEGNFEEVRNRGGSRSYGNQDSQSQAPQLSLDNKYDSLPQDQS